MKNFDLCYIDKGLMLHVIKASVPYNDLHVISRDIYMINSVARKQALQRGVRVHCITQQCCQIPCSHDTYTTTAVDATSMRGQRQR